MTLDQEMQSALEQAAAADRGEDIQPTQTPAPAATPAPATASPETTETPAEQGEAQKQQQEKPKDEPEATPTDQKPETAFTKAQKEKARRDDSWKKLNEDKEQLARDRQQLQQERELIAREKAEASRRTPPAPKADKPKYSADEYEAAAKRLEDEGQYELAEQARKEAVKQRANPPGQEPEPAAQAVPQRGIDQQQFIGAWKNNLSMLEQAEPDLKKQDSELYKATAEALRKYPLLSTYPTGIRDAVEAAKLIIQSGRVPALEKELAAAKAELGRLNKTNSLKGGPPGMPPSATKTLDEMTLDEADAFARKAAAQADREG